MKVLKLPREFKGERALDPLLDIVVPLFDQFDPARPRVASDDGETASDESEAGHHSLRKKKTIEKE